MTRNDFRRGVPLLLLVASATLAGCASLPRNNAMLDEARSAYRSANSNPVVAKSAPIELKKAEDAIQHSENLLNDNADSETVNHYAYLAKQHAAIAEEKGKQASAEQAIEAASQERDRVIILSRTAEAEAARQRAADNALIAEASARQAQARTQDAEAARRQADAAAERSRALQAQLDELQARQTERGLVLTLGDVLFDTAKATLKPGAMRTVDQLAAFLNQYPERKVLIEGHTDSVGGDEYNLRLSERRADAVRNALLDRGIAADRIMTRGLGKAYPVAGNDTAASRQRNRRVEVIISDETGKIVERGR